MYPPKISNEVGLVLRDPKGKLAAEIRAARAAGKPLYIVGRGRAYGPPKEKPNLKK